MSVRVVYVKEFALYVKELAVYFEERGRVCCLDAWNGMFYVYYIK